MAFLGLDLGTSGLRALLMSADGAPIGACEAQYQTHAPRPGWSEQNPADWVAALEQVVAELRAAHPEFQAVKGVAVSGHMHGAVLLSADNAVLRPCILWNDTRSAAEAARLDAMEGVRALSGNIVFPGFTAPKLDWVRAHEPALHAQMAKVLLPASYLNWVLTGLHVMDLSDASGTSWLDVGARDWSAPLLAASHMRRDQMPRLVDGCAVAGPLRPELAERWGLAGPVTVAGGAGDNAAAACGIGALNEGEGFVSLGTSGVLLLARERYAPAPETALHSFCHAIPERWYQMGVMLSAAASLNWLGGITGCDAKSLTAELGEVVRPPGQVTFLPYLAGERTPHNDAGAQGAFTGLSSQTTRADMTRAVLEGVAFGLRDSMEAMRRVGAQLGPLHCVGGGSASRYWVKLIATVLGVPLHLPAGGEYGAALGAARLAQIAATGATPAEVMRAPEVADTITPDPDLAEAFEIAYQRFKAAYPAIRAVQ